MATETPKPGFPSQTEAKATVRESIFELRFRKAGLIQTLRFMWPDKQGAIDKGREYCEKKGLRFIFVDEWLSDIQKLIDFQHE